jgi:hypothetical protein
MTITYSNGAVVQISEVVIVLAMMWLGPAAIVLTVTLAGMVSACVKHFIEGRDP